MISYSIWNLRTYIISKEGNYRVRFIISLNKKTLGLEPDKVIFDNKHETLRTCSVDVSDKMLPIGHSKIQDGTHLLIPDISATSSTMCRQSFPVFLDVCIGYIFIEIDAKYYYIVTSY